MRQVSKNNTLNCSSANEPTLLNPSIGATATATDEKILIAEHRVTWYNYYLDQAVDLYSVATIVANTDHQYFSENHEDYVGYVNKTTRLVIEQIETHLTIINKENVEIRAAFFAPP